jgi:hypothetical protein
MSAVRPTNSLQEIRLLEVNAARRGQTDDFGRVPATPYAHVRRLGQIDTAIKTGEASLRWHYSWALTETATGQSGGWHRIDRCGFGTEVNRITSWAQAKTEVRTQAEPQF